MKICPWLEFALRTKKNDLGTLFVVVIQKSSIENQLNTATPKKVLQTYTDCSGICKNSDVQPYFYA